MANPPQGPKDATPITRAHNRAVLDALPFGDTRDFEDARRDFLGSLPEVEIKNDQGAESCGVSGPMPSWAMRRPHPR
jgi:alkyl sulfatase BDS1-like metallo-beta-lactamase superfamily hydrolase